MLAKCGSLITWHWAHAPDAACDPWRTGETRWHLALKERFLNSGAGVEVPITRNGERHIADVVTPDGTIIELAHSYPPGNQIAVREAFYGRMAWVYDADRFTERVDIYRKSGELRFRWRQPVKSMTLHRRPVYWHGQERNGVWRLCWIRRYPDEEGHHRTYGRLEPAGDTDEFVSLATIPAEDRGAGTA